MLNLGELIATIKADTAQFDNAMKGTVTKMKRTGDSMKAVGKQMSMAISLPLAGIGFAAVKTGADFEKAMNQVAAVSGATTEQLQRMEKVARDLGKSTKFSAKEAADGLSFLAMAGFSVEEQISALPGALQLAAAGGMDLATAADIVSNVISGFGMQANETGMMVDVLAKTFTSSNTNLSQLGEAMSYAAPVMATFGQSVQTASSAIGALSDAGIQGSRAGTGLSQIMSILSQEGHKMGISIYDSAGRTKALFDIIAEIEEKGVSGAEVMNIFGQRAGPAMSVLLAKGSAGLKEFEKEIENSGGTAQKVSDKQMKGLAGAFTEFRSALSELGIAFSKAGINSFFEKLVDSATELTLWLSSLSDTTKNFIAITGGILVVLGPVTTVMGMLISSILPKVIGLVGGLTAAFKAFSLVIMANPITAAATALALLAGGIYLYSTRTDEATKRQREYNDVAKEATKEMTKQKAELGVLQNNLKRSSENIDSLKKSMEWMQKGTADYTAKSQALRIEEEKRKNIITELNTNYGEYLQNNIDTATTYKDIATELTKVNTLLDEQIKKQALQAITADVQNRLVKSMQDQFVLQTKLNSVTEDSLDLNDKLLLSYLPEERQAAAIANMLEIKRNAVRNEIAAEKNKYNQLLTEFDGYSDKLETLMAELANRQKKTTTPEGGTGGTEEEKRLMKIKEATDLYIATMAELKKELQAVDNQFKLFGDSIDVAGDKQKAFTKAITALMPTFAPTSKEVQGLVKQFNELDKVAVLQVFDALQKQLKIIDRDFGFTGDAAKRNSDQLSAMKNAYQQVIGNVAAADYQLQSLIDTMRTLEGVQVGVIEKMDSMSLAIQRGNDKLRTGIDKSITEQPAEDFANAWTNAMEGLADFQQYFAPIAGGVQNLLSSVGQLYQAQENARLAAVEKRAAAERWTEERLAKEKEKIAREFAKKKKQIDLAQAYINIALGITSAFVPYVPGLSEVMAGLVASAGAIQIAAINAQPLATGGIVPPGYPNDNYPARLTSGEMVVPAKKLPDFAAIANNRFDDSRIVSAIMNKAETHFNITENGIKVTSKKGNDYISHINRSYRK